MKSFKYIHNYFTVLLLIMAYCTNSEGTFVCGHHRHHHLATSTPKYDFSTKTIITSNPETKIDIVKFSPKNESKIFYVLKKGPISKENNDYLTKANALVSIIKALQGSTQKNHTTIAHPTPTTAKPGSPQTTPQQSTNLHINNHVVNGHSYVYNIQNYGRHYHNYDPKSTDESNPHRVDIVPLEMQNKNQNRKKDEWINNVKLS